MRIAISPAAIGAFQFNINFIPQFLMWEEGANPLTNLRVEEQNAGVLCDLPLAGLAEVTRFQRFGNAASTFRMLRLANGTMFGKNVTITAGIAGAVAVPLYASGDTPGNVAIKYQSAALLAGTPMPFKDFTALYLPGLGVNDTVLVRFDNGHTQLFHREELLEFAAMYQNSQAATNFIVNNVNSYISEVTVTQAVAGPAYIQRLAL